MLPQEQLDRLVIVLVRARNPNNIGAVARAMHDFGFRHLRVVNEHAVPFHDARSAVDALEVLKGAVVCGSVADAVGDCSLVVGTTAVGDRVLDHPLHLLPQAAPILRGEMAKREGRVALLFGSEKTGLSNEELSYCNWLTTIPMRAAEGQRHVSMNLGQAAAVCLFELVREAGTCLESCAETMVPGGDLERLTGLLDEVLTKTDYKKRHPATSDVAHIRRLVRRMALEPSDAAVWMGVLRQALWKLGRE